MTMSTADRQVIEMANRPRERMDRMEKMAKIARYRRAIRRKEQAQRRSRWLKLRRQFQWAAAATGTWAVIIGMVALAVVN